MYAGVLVVGDGVGQRLGGKGLIEFGGIQPADQRADDAVAGHRTEDREAGGVAVGIGEDAAGVGAGAGLATGRDRVGIDYHQSAGRRHLGAQEAHGNAGHRQSTAIDVNLDGNYAGAAGGPGQRGRRPWIPAGLRIDYLDAGAAVDERLGLREIDADGIHLGTDDALQERIQGVSTLERSLVQPGNGESIVIRGSSDVEVGQETKGGHQPPVDGLAGDGTPVGVGNLDHHGTEEGDVGLELANGTDQLPVTGDHLHLCRGGLRGRGRRRD